MSVRLEGWNPQPARPPWGVRVEPRKAGSTGRPIRPLPLPARVEIPLDRGHAGIAEPEVAVGDPVLTGQVIARAGPLAVHASIAGVVTGIRERPIVGGRGPSGPCIVIDGDGTDRWHPSVAPPPAAAIQDPAAIVGYLAAAGIVGLGGAQFPADRKLAGAPLDGVLIINGAECEPYISCDEMLIRTRPDAVLAGTRVMMGALGCPSAVIAVESDMPAARVALAEAIEAAGIGDIGVAVVTAKYPAGGERQLIELLTGREVPEHGLPRDVGCICQNVGTAVAVADLFATGRPLVSRIVTVTGAAVPEPVNVEARIGTALGELLAAAGGLNAAPSRLIVGGPMMGVEVPDAGMPVCAATNCVIAATAEEFPAPGIEMPCIRCGDCVEVCPARLMPQELLAACAADDRAGLAMLGLDACIECRSCDYVCPSQIALTPRFVAAKTRLHASRTAALLARTARERHANREARRAADAEARDAALAAQDAALGQDEDAALAALLARVERGAPGPGREG